MDKTIVLSNVNRLFEELCMDLEVFAVVNNKPIEGKFLTDGRTAKSYVDSLSKKYPNCEFMIQSVTYA